MNRFKLLTTVTCLVLLGHMSLAQQPNYTPERQARMAGQYQPGYQNNYGPGGGYDRRSDIFRIERLDRVVDLNGRQKRDLFSLEQYYDRQFSVAPPSPGAYKQLMWQKSQDVLAVLTPFQRDRLFAFEQYKAYGGNAYGTNYGRSNGWGNQPGGNRPGGGQR